MFQSKLIFQSSNKRILFNLLPAHVATHFLDNQFRNNLVKKKETIQLIYKRKQCMYVSRIQRQRNVSSFTKCHLSPHQVLKSLANSTTHVCQKNHNRYN